MEACIDKMLSVCFSFFVPLQQTLAPICSFRKSDRWITICVIYFPLEKKVNLWHSFQISVTGTVGSKLWHVCQKTSCAYFVCVVIIAKSILQFLVFLGATASFSLKNMKTLWNFLMNLPEAMLLSVTGKVWVSRPSEWSETPYLSLTSVKW